MKTIIVLTFFGILGCTFCTAPETHVPTGPEHCRDVYKEADPNFKRDQ
uniref:Uncharacterized protein n=2 Tax=Rhodnius prolixus TaxID=13249 RepID=T1I8W9_RHOPR